MSIFESLISAEFSRAFAWTIFHSLWQGTVIALMAAGLMFILRKHRPGIRYGILYIILLMMPVFFAGTFMMTYKPGNITNKEPAGITRYQDEGNFNELPVNSLIDAPRPWFSQTVQLFENHSKWLVLMWFLGFIVFLIRFSGSVLYVYRLKNYHVYQVDEAWRSNLKILSHKIGLNKNVRLTESALARIPMTIGYLKPVILLPLGTLSGVPPQQIDAILLHELAHIMRKDYLLNIVQSLIELLFFYHPVTWWLSAKIRQEREHICDDIAIGVNLDHINYIKALTTMEELNSKSPLLATAITGSKKKLLLRIKRLISPVKLRKGLGEGIIAFILLIGLIFTLSFNALSFIPSAYDMTGRESGEKIFNFLPFNPNSPVETKTIAAVIQPAIKESKKPQIPDTIVATSRSGKVKISVYTDSTDKAQQEYLQQMAESMDRQAQHQEQAIKQYQLQMELADDQRKMQDARRQVMVITRQDSVSSSGDSVVVIYSESVSPWQDNRSEYKFQHWGNTALHEPMIRHHYAQPGSNWNEDFGPKVFSFGNDSIDTIIIVKPGEHYILKDLKDIEWTADVLEDRIRDIERFEWSEEELEDRMMDIQIDMERDFPEKEMENFFYYNVPPIPPDPFMKENIPEHRVQPAEKIIRQELRDDGLTERGRKYVIEIDSKAMFINGEKQPKEIYRKYRKLVESLENAQLAETGTYKLIF